MSQKNYIYVSHTNMSKRSPWKLFFRGKGFETLASYNEDDVFSYPTGQQALLVALKLRDTTPTGAIVIVDPSLEAKASKPA